MVIRFRVDGSLHDDTVRGIVAQRLVRRLCNECKTPTEYTEEYLEHIGFQWDEKEQQAEPTFYKATGCKVCNGTGWKGRVGIHEILLVNEKIEEAIVNGEQAMTINQIAINTGMRSLKTDGLEKAGQGLTTVEEVLATIVQK